LALDQPVIQELLRKLDEFVGHLRSVVKLPYSDYAADENLQAATERRLQLTIQACIDIAEQVVALRGLRLPESAADSFAVLREAGYLAADQAETMKKLVGLRNILVHDYLSLDTGRVYEELHRHLRSLEEFAHFCALLPEVSL